MAFRATFWQCRGAAVRRVHILAGICGAFVAWASGIDLLTLLGVFRGPNGGAVSHALGYAVVGLLASGGSAFWNRVLDILQAAKVRQEQQAGVAVTASTLKDQIPASTPAQATLAPA